MSCDNMNEVTILENNSFSNQNQPIFNIISEQHQPSTLQRNTKLTGDTGETDISRINNQPRLDPGGAKKKISLPSTKVSASLKRKRASQGKKGVASKNAGSHGREGRSSSIQDKTAQQANRSIDTFFKYDETARHEMSPSGEFGLTFKQGDTNGFEKLNSTKVNQMNDTVTQPWGVLTGMTGMSSLKDVVVSSDAVKKIKSPNKRFPGQPGAPAEDDGKAAVKGSKFLDGRGSLGNKEKFLGLSTSAIIAEASTSFDEATKHSPKPEKKCLLNELEDQIIPIKILENSIEKTPLPRIDDPYGSSNSFIQLSKSYSKLHNSQEKPLASKIMLKNATSNKAHQVYLKSCSINTIKLNLPKIKGNPATKSPYKQGFRSSSLHPPLKQQDHPGKIAPSQSQYLRNQAYYRAAINSQKERLERGVNARFRHSEQEMQVLQPVNIQNYYEGLQGKGISSSKQLPQENSLFDGGASTTTPKNNNDGSKQDLSRDNQDLKYSQVMQVSQHQNNSIESSIHDHCLFNPTYSATSKIEIPQESVLARVETSISKNDEDKEQIALPGSVDETASQKFALIPSQSHQNPQLPTKEDEGSISSAGPNPLDVYKNVEESLQSSFQPKRVTRRSIEEELQCQLKIMQVTKLYANGPPGTKKPKKGFESSAGSSAKNLISGKPSDFQSKISANQRGILSKFNAKKRKLKIFENSLISQHLSGKRRISKHLADFKEIYQLKDRYSSSTKQYNGPSSLGFKGYVQSSLGFREGHKNDSISAWDTPDRHSVYGQQGAGAGSQFKDSTIFNRHLSTKTLSERKNIQMGSEEIELDNDQISTAKGQKSQALLDGLHQQQQRTSLPIDRPSVLDSLGMGEDRPFGWQENFKLTIQTTSPLKKKTILKSKFIQEGKSFSTLVPPKHNSSTSNFHERKSQYFLREPRAPMRSNTVLQSTMATKYKSGFPPRDIDRRSSSLEGTGLQDSASIQGDQVPVSVLQDLNLVKNFELDPQQKAKIHRLDSRYGTTGFLKQF